LRGIGKQWGLCEVLQSLGHMRMLQKKPERVSKIFSTFEDSSCGLNLFNHLANNRTFSQFLDIIGGI